MVCSVISSPSYWSSDLRVVIYHSEVLHSKWWPHDVTLVV